jgi:hypothetical protein
LVQASRSYFITFTTQKDSRGSGVKTSIQLTVAKETK